MREMWPSDGPELIQRLVRDRDPPDRDVVGYELLRAFQRGFPVQNLRELLLASDDRLVDLGAWIASELGPSGSVLIADMVSLLKHPSKNVRFFAIDALLNWLTPDHAVECLAVIGMLNDDDAAVRWKAIDFLSLISMAHLERALFYVRSFAPESKHIRGLEFLTARGGDADEVTKMLQGSNDLTRKYALAAAARIARERHVMQPLLYAASIDTDPDVRRFALDMLTLTA